VKPFNVKRAALAATVGNMLRGSSVRLRPESGALAGW
jgi:hypothetical protein